MMGSPDRQTNKTETTESNLAHLSDVMKKFHTAFANDPNLVREGAKHHGVNVTEGTILDAPISHAYSARIPTGSKEELEAIQKAPVIVLGCMDYRQVHELYEQYGSPAVFIADAGGAAQPNEDRFNMTVELLTAIHAVNPEARLILTGHIEVCGGADHFTGGKMKEIRSGKNGKEEEIEVMSNYLQKTASALKKAGVSQDVMEINLALVDEKNTFRGIKPLSIQQ